MIKDDFVPDMTWHSSPFLNKLVKFLIEARDEILVCTSYFTPETSSLLKKLLLTKKIDNPFDILVVTPITEKNLLDGRIDLGAIMDCLDFDMSEDLKFSFRSVPNLDQTFIIIDGELLLLLTGKFGEDSMSGNITNMMEINDEELVGNALSDFDRIWKAGFGVKNEDIVAFRDFIGDIPTITVEEEKRMGIPLQPLGADGEKIKLVDGADMCYELLEEAENAAEFDEDHDAAIGFIERALCFNSDSVRGNFLRGKYLYEFKHDLDGALTSFEKLISLEDENEKAQLYKAKILFEKERGNEALQVFDKVTTLNPQNGQAWHYKGVLLAKYFKKYLDAIKCLDMAIKLDSYQDISWYEKGSIYYHNLNNVEEAIRFTRGAIRINPENIDAIFLMAKILLEKKGDKEGALSKLKSVLEKNDEHVGALELIGTVLEEMGNGAQALEYFEHTLEKKPGNIAALMGKAKVLYKNYSRYDESLKYFKQVLAIDPKNTGSYLNIAIILIKLGNPKEARYVLDELLNIDNSNDEAFCIYGELLSDHLNMHDEGLKYLEKATKNNPGNVGAWMKKGHILATHFERGYDALDCYNYVIKIDPDKLDALYKKGLVLSELIGDPESALLSFDEVTKRDHNHKLAWYDKGVVLCSHYKRYEDGILCFNKVLDLDPKDPDAWYNKGNALVDLERYEEALMCFENALTIDPNIWQIWNNVGNAFRYLRKYNKALEALDRAISINPKNDDVWLNKGDVLMEMGRYNNAIESFEVALKLNPKDKSAEEKINYCYNKISEDMYYT